MANTSFLIARARKAAPAVAALVAAAVTQPALAQSSVSLYGVVDTGIVHADRGGAHVLQIQSGILAGSRWGLRGTEDIGGGLKGIFVLESGIDSDTGALKNFSGNPGSATPTAPNGVAGQGFNRRSFVGLETPAGTFTLGRDYTPFFYAGQRADIFGYGLFGNVQSIASLTGTVERWVRVSNALFYVSPNFGGLRVRAAYSLGSESAGTPGTPPRGSNVFAGIGGEYTAGGLVVTASHQQLRMPDVAGTPAAFTGSKTTVKDSLIGARYTFGQFAVSGGYWDSSAPWNANNVWVGGSVDIGGGTLLAQVQKLRQDNPAGAERQATVFGVGYVYPLSKRTSVYASYGRVSNGPTSSVTLFSSDASVAPLTPGADPKATAIGIRHSF